ncbi:hypothetical protein LTS18_000411, partial [Coniosporium uncinatum]
MAINQYPKPVSNRFASNPGPPAALHNDPFRSQSMAGSRPQMQPGPGGNYNIAPAHTFRQQQYANHPSRTTAQGRIVPERHDERTMSMTSYNRDNDHHQTMSGRIIPGRRREPAVDGVIQERAATMQSNAPPSPSTVSPVTKARRPSQGSNSFSSRTMSLASTAVNTINSDRTATMQSNLTKSNSQSTQSPVYTAQRKSPLVYPALLSRVAETFRERILVNDQEKDGLDYKAAFTGAQAVDVIAFIIKTTDRNLALLLGRSLDAQKFFHDVTYAHRLRDSQAEIYQFRVPVVEGPTDVEVNG